jgi:hypothetical protein
MTGTRGLEAISETEKQSLEDPPTHLADILLDRVFNPAGDPELARATPDQLLEACGLSLFLRCLPTGGSGKPGRVYARQYRGCYG